jgi:glycyl-tRNA synthetase
MFKTNIGVGEGNLGYLRGEACQNIFLDFKRIYGGARRNLPLAIAQWGKAFRNEISPRNTLIRGREFTQMDIELFFTPEEIDNFPIEDM